MILQNLNPKQYKRFFAFGCSFTNYVWPTWADIIAQDVPFYENWAERGAGNRFIFNSVIEADIRHNFNNDDLVMIMWSAPGREDRYSNGQWLHANANQQEEVYGKEWLRKFSTDTRAHLIHDYSYIRATQELLKNRNCNWSNFVMYPIAKLEENMDRARQAGLYTDTQIREFWYAQWNNLCAGDVDFSLFEHADVVETYKDIFKNIKASYECIETFLRRDYNSVPKVSGVINPHPTPNDALYFLDLVWPDNDISTRAREYASYWNSAIYKTTEWSTPIHKDPAITRL